MRLTIAGGMVVMLVCLFILGAFTGSPLMLISSFCVGPFAVFYAGYVTGAAGLRIAVVSESAQPARRKIRGATFDG